MYLPAVSGILVPRKTIHNGGINFCKREPLCRGSQYGAFDQSEVGVRWALVADVSEGIETWSTSARRPWFN